MKKQIKPIFCYRLLLIFSLAAMPLLQAKRSTHRPKDPLMPELSARWSTKKKAYTIRESYIEEYPIFKVFDRKHFFDNMLPKSPIQFRNEPNKYVDGKKLNKLIDGLFVEIKKKKRRFKHFKVLQKKNFNRGKKCGLMVLKFKDYPFVLKFFMETPRTFVNPYCKGFDNVVFFAMGGGTNRHINGLTRTKNMQLVHKKLSTHPEWSKTIDLPRKWHWIPKENNWIHVTGKNIGAHSAPIKTEVPGVYCVIADAISGKKYGPLDMFNKKISKLAINLCNYLDNIIDPHIDNFMLEQATKKIIIVDTEHFPTAVGLKKKVEFKGYKDWYSNLAGICGHAWFSRTKRTRRMAQTSPNELRLL